MPEMPEVETVRRTLRPLVVGKTIDHVDIWYDKVITGDPETFKRELKGKTFTAVDRYAKFLLFRLGDLTVVSHLRMEGKYHLTTWDAPVDKHEHLQFAFTDGSSLRYADVRKFGRLQLVETGTEFQVTGLKNLGVEANSPEFSLDYFEKGLKKRSMNIKSLLMSQTLVAGLGNIYVDEVLWQSRINPLTPANELTKDQVKQLHSAINETIEEATKYGGTTVHSFLNAEGESGHYQEKLKVYGKEGQPCPRCGEDFVKIKISGRGTTYCLHCQKRV
ncbi:DNA-formamidopyrimidine glycosylase [Lactobacillus delbrueckii]|uniref:Formamidopyrimidine-DNA glycosylase n=2 Tax=Lactobacillus delbrueckii TaxID=1584 RepID=A0A4Q7DV42_9LACO|nr:DNA-formamidopyrimidine glycosylase [Lactobacillus delbrueckii]RZM16169.1 5-hydroxymethyluracil DNA glycosylase [Lactobacillus delbrueckii]UNL39413.1 DNA-formamidopyrimidine glycosylase [Lactobacillus delbrueckii]